MNYLTKIKGLEWLLDKVKQNKSYLTNKIKNDVEIQNREYLEEQEKKKKRVEEYRKQREQQQLQQLQQEQFINSTVIIKYLYCNI